MYINLSGIGGHLSPSNPAFTLHELEKQLIVSKAKYLIAHPFNLDTALAAAKLVGIPSSNVWSIIKDPKNRAPDWRSIILNGKDEADPIRFTVEQSKNALAYICFSSGTTGNTRHCFSSILTMKLIGFFYRPSQRRYD
jgi:acyl-CoA synthetase (AMP-forming)/AMP-acid ligase II